VPQALQSRGGNSGQQQQQQKCANPALRLLRQPTYQIPIESDETLFFSTFCLARGLGLSLIIFSLINLQAVQQKKGREETKTKRPKLFSRTLTAAPLSGKLARCIIKLIEKC